MKTLPDDRITSKHAGITKREYFSVLALQGLLTRENVDLKNITVNSVKVADALIEELNKEKKNEIRTGNDE